MKNEYVATSLGNYKITLREGTSLVVFFNGAGGFDTADTFAPIIERLPPKLGILAIDYLNTGLSSLQKKDYDLTEDIQNMTEMIIEHNPKKIIMVAHSLGGIYARLVAAKLTKVTGFVGIEPTTLEILSGIPDTPEYQAKNKEFESMTPAQAIENMKKQSEKNFTKKQYADLWQHFYEDDQRDSNKQQQQQVQAFMNEITKMNASKFPVKLKSKIFTEKYREDEYKRSEYYTKQTEIISLGDNHYLYWDYPAEIAQKIQELV
ncbi:alpha/beta fold hydrolase [Lactobacillus amylolyticus]|jgi:pimeloyl-ACP methyl ester carboxylesterase|uniref:alpha/beta fold hydrolase n=1 Tax=Lactobacillus amylolyticus TaxID=83683 RepID=UPI0024901223|nr:alpha/beta hydrolase [Lactobacillus amylolyticus]